jgi:hypothetical protein
MTEPFKGVLDSGELMVLELGSFWTVQQKPGQPSDTTVHKTL